MNPAAIIAIMDADIHEALSITASVEAAWRSLLDEMGIDREEMPKASPARHHAVEVIISLSVGEEIPEYVEVHLQAMHFSLTAGGAFLCPLILEGAKEWEPFQTSV